LTLQLQRRLCISGRSSEEDRVAGDLAGSVDHPSSKTWLAGWPGQHGWIKRSFEWKNHPQIKIWTLRYEHEEQGVMKP